MTFTEAAAAVGIEAEAIELNQVELADLQTATHFIVVTSTFGDGEFPDNAVLFWEAISAATDRLEHLSFAVLALGDISYDLFCNAGKLLDERLKPSAPPGSPTASTSTGSTRNRPPHGRAMFSRCWLPNRRAPLRPPQRRRRQSSRTTPRSRAGNATSRSRLGWPSTGCSTRRNPTRRSGTTRSTWLAPGSPTAQAIPSQYTPRTIRPSSMLCLPLSAPNPISWSTAMTNRSAPSLPSTWRSARRRMLCRRSWPSAPAAGTRHGRTARMCSTSSGSLT